MFFFHTEISSLKGFFMDPDIYIYIYIYIYLNAKTMKF